MKTLNKIFVAAALILALATGAWFLGRLSVVENEKSIAVPLVAENSLSSSSAVVTKVLDGDTVVVTGGDHVRLLGIDADESGYPCYDAARLRLEELVLGKSVQLEPDREDVDQYGRKLRYIFLDGSNINEMLVAQGLVVARFYPENQKYKTEITVAETAAMADKVGCKWNGQAQAAAVSPEAEKVADNKNYTWEKLIGTAIDPCETKNHIGQEVIVEGVVVDAYRSASNTVFLNFGKKYPDNCFVAVIFESDLPKFSDSPEKNYGNKTVRIKGKVAEYEGKPEIILKNELQIEAGE